MRTQLFAVAADQASAAALAALGVGIAVLLLVLLWPWKGVGPWWHELLPKWASAFMQVCSVIAALRAAYQVAAEDRPDWWAPVCFAVFAGFTWKFVQVAWDVQAKRAERVLKEDLERARREGELRTRLVGAIGGWLNQKLTRLTGCCDGLGNAQRTVNHARVALTPDGHIRSVLNALAGLLLEQASARGEDAPSFRLGVYVEHQGSMRPVHWLDTDGAGYNPFTSWQAHPTFFQLAGQGPHAHAVRCVLKQDILIVEDCEAAERAGTLTFFNEHQRSYLRSMVAYYIGHVRLEDGTITRAGLVIDTRLRGFFKESEQAFLKLCLREFGRRISLEMCLADLLRG